MTRLDCSHDATLKSWVASANGHREFPIQNLPLGVFSPPDGKRRGGIAIGDKILDLSGTLSAGLLTGKAEAAAQTAAGATLNPFMALDAVARTALRLRLVELFEEASTDRCGLEPLLYDSAECRMYLPATIGDYTDFYAGLNHATNAGRLFRPDNPLLPNYKYVPIGYHGRASSIRPSGEPVQRPLGQRKLRSEAVPSFGPARNLDYELELGIWIGQANALGSPISIAKAAEHIVGFCLLNDWSARDIQAWEYQPLGPFLAKNFSTTISPWLVTVEALAPFRTAQQIRPEGDPRPLPYLWDPNDQLQGGLNVALEVFIETPMMKSRGLPPHRLSSGNGTDLYWTVAQLVTHHTSGGCNLNPGDLLGTGTISGSLPAQAGSLLELTKAGTEPLIISSGEARRFLEDGDEVIFRASCHRDGFTPIGFGECRARIEPAREPE
jgi:fumarylacetoacetase